MMRTAPTVSLIVCTLGRREPLSRLLASLEKQTDQNFETIIVDQNAPGFLDPVLDPFPGPNLRRLNSTRGLSRARNRGLAEARGTIVGFPDDDCWYDTTVVAQAVRFFAANPNQGVLTGRTIDAGGEGSVSPYRKASGPIERGNVFLSGNSNTLFVRRDIALEVGGFDETLGVGSGVYESGEETDFLLRCLAIGCNGFFDRDFVVRHEQSADDTPRRLIRARAYAAGYGRILKDHRFSRSVIIEKLLRATLRGTVCALQGDRAGAAERYAWIRGVAQGYASASGARPTETPPKLARNT